jgi:tryptophanyl-tRNA synthetase
MKLKKRILTGDRPTGKLHLGHYVGTLENRLRLQEEYETFLLVADYHVLTTNANNIPDIRANALEDVRDNLAVGIDQSIVTCYLQSDVPEVAELALLFGMLANVKRLELVPTLKDQLKAAGQESPSYGLLGYPVLQSADILLVNAECVPVGKDQESHVEMTREIASRFNRLYGKTFVEPKAVIGRVASLIGLDGMSKMSKSLGNTIMLDDVSAEVRRKVMSMYTDPNRIRSTEPGNVDTNPVFIYHDAFNSNDAEVQDLKERYQKGKVGDVEVKEKLYLALESFLEPIRERRSTIKDSDVIEILKEGAKKVRPIARETLSKARALMKIPDFS